jgi:hypothetical protein
MQLSEKEKRAAKAFARMGGLKGGKARAEALSPEERSEIARLAAEKRWETSKPALPKEEYTGILKIGGKEIPCAVLDNGLRVLSTSGLSRAMGSRKKGINLRPEDREIGSPQIPPFLYAANVKPFISDDLMTPLKSPIRYKMKSGGMALGYEATLLQRTCDVILDAYEAGVLRPSQQYLVDTAKILRRGFATVGIIALVDEATGYQYDRARQALEQILREFISNELRKWVKTFPDEFYFQVCRLKNWRISEIPSHRTLAFGKITNDLVYERLAPNLLQRLKRITPKNEKGRPKHKYFQRLTEDVGDPRLREHLASEITLMRVFDDGCWDDFYKAANRALPKQVYLPLFDQAESEATPRVAVQLQ